jgi:hypothetical protein
VSRIRNADDEWEEWLNEIMRRDPDYIPGLHGPGKRQRTWMTPSRTYVRWRRTVADAINSHDTTQSP